MDASDWLACLSFLTHPLTSLGGFQSLASIFLFFRNYPRPDGREKILKSTSSPELIIPTTLLLFKRNIHVFEIYTYPFSLLLCLLSLWKLSAPLPPFLFLPRIKFVLQRWQKSTTWPRRLSGTKPRRRTPPTTHQRTKRMASRMQPRTRNCFWEWEIIFIKV